jgi:hypothetical protein
MRCPAAHLRAVATVGIMPKNDASQATAEPISCDAVQRIFEATAAATENFAPPPAAAMRGESEVLWNAFYKNRFNRRRELLPNLRLKYPDDNELRCIAQLAEVRDTLAFGQSIPSIILDAHLSDQAFRTLSIPEVSKAINDVTEQAELLKKILTQTRCGERERGIIDGGWASN